MLMNYLYGSTVSSISEREHTNYSIAREAATEGFVLLKNDGALPLANKTIALFGTGARKTMKGGTGSGEVQPRHSISIEQGLENAGCMITTKSYLDDYDTECENSYQSFRSMLDRELADIQDPMQALYQSFEYHYQYPTARSVTEEDIYASHTNTAIYVIMRQAGEGHDRRQEPGDYQLTDTERDDIKKIAAAYKHTILVINIGGQLDLGFMDDITGIGALVFYVQGGMEGGNALADVLTGKSNFSGKLTDTWAKRYEDIPCSNMFSYLNGNLSEEEYSEGIYVGYRYFDSFGIELRYPFGFGLSYTDFNVSVTDIIIDNGTVTVKVIVKNTGNTYSGKEVVQAYLSCPDGRLLKEQQRLVAFVKTGTLAPGETQTASLSFDMTQASGYDESASAWILEKGEYIVRVGNSSRNTSIAAVLTLDETVTLEQCRPCCAPETPIYEIKAPASSAVSISANVKRIDLNPSAFVTKTHNYAEPPVMETEREKSLLDSLTIEEMAELVRGGDLSSNPLNIHAIEGAVGRTAISLVNKGIGNVLFSDGPAGLNLMDHVKICSDGTRKMAYLPEKYNVGAFGKMMSGFAVASDGDDIYRYATAWPVALLLAQTWNTHLAERVGKAVGAEMEEFGITLWLAPGMNIHRNPLCGRNFEYFSEDPYLSGVMAAAVTKGVQSIDGIGTTIKHFACNNQEDNRMQVSSNINERALREIYLKGFEIAVKNSRPKALMTSYNRLNGTYTPNRHDLVTDILRCEWGFDGMVMTDWSSCDPGRGKPELCVPAGNDLVMPGTEADKKAIANALISGIISKDTLRRCACRVLRTILNSRIYE